MSFHATRLLTERFPPPPPEGRNHAIHRRTDGREGLTVILQIGDLSQSHQWQSVLLDPEDMDREPEEIVEEIAEMLAGERGDPFPVVKNVDVPPVD